VIYGVVVKTMAKRRVERHVSGIEFGKVLSTSRMPSMLNPGAMSWLSC